MRVSLGTIEIDDLARKAVRRDRGERGHATRGDVKEWASELINSRLGELTGTTPAPAVAAASSTGDEE